MQRKSETLYLGLDRLALLTSGEYTEMYRGGPGRRTGSMFLAKLGVYHLPMPADPERVRHFLEEFCPFQDDE